MKTHNNEVPYVHLPVRKAGATCTNPTLATSQATISAFIMHGH